MTAPSLEVISYFVWKMIVRERTLLDSRVFVHVNSLGTKENCLRSVFFRTVSGQPALTLLVVGHLPFVILYFVNLWQTRAHYQFFPFAIATFIWLAASRRQSGNEQWTWLPRILIGADVFCAASGVLVRSPWLVTAGLFLGVLAWCVANIDEGFRRRLTYLAILPLLVIRLPRNGDQQIILDLQTITTKMASQILDRFGFLHFCSGNVLEFPGKRFMVEEACSGVQSLFTVLFIGAFVVCWLRRPLPHIALVLMAGALFAGFMNLCRILVIAIAWDQYGADLSVGIPHDMVGYLSLGAATLLLLTFDAALTVVTDPIPLSMETRESGNPFVILWNTLFMISPTQESPVPAQEDAGSPWRKRNVVLCAAGFSFVMLAVQVYVVSGQF